MEEKLDNHMEAIERVLTDLNNNVEETIKKIKILERKVDKLCEKVDGEVLEECKKMGGHIDFVEEVYKNVKHPLGFICKKIGYLTGSSKEQYTLTSSIKEQYTLTELNNSNDQIETDDEN